MTIQLRRAIDDPVGNFLLFEAAFITDPVFHFTPLIFSCGYAQNVIAAHPQSYLTLAGWAIPVCIHRLGKPYTILKAKGSVGKRPHRTYIDDIAYKFVVEIILNKSSDLGVIPAIKHTVLS